MNLGGGFDVYFVEASDQPDLLVRSDLSDGDEEEGR